MAAKGRLDSLSVNAQVHIIDLFASTLPWMKDGGMREWHVAWHLNECCGLDTVSRLSKESYSLSRKQVSPTLSDLMDLIFTSGNKLTLLATSASPQTGGRYVKKSLNAEVFMRAVKRFLGAEVIVSMREFHIRAYDYASLSWPEADRGLVRPCPRCSSYEWISTHETFHFRNEKTAQWLTVELRRLAERDRSREKRTASFRLVQTPTCVVRHELTVHRRHSLVTTIIIDALQCLPRSEVEKCLLLARSWRNLLNARTRSLPLRDVDLDMIESSGKLCMSADGPTLAVPFAPFDGLSPSPSELLRNAYVQRLEIRDETCKEITAILREVLHDSDLRIGEVSATSFSSTSEVVDSTLWMSSLWRLIKLEMDPIPFTLFVENVNRIVDASGLGRARHLYLDIFCDDHSLQPPPAVYEGMRNRWVDLVFDSGCEELIIVSRRSFSEGTQFPFNVDGVIEHFLSMKIVGSFTTCVIDAINVKRLPDACEKPIATHQNAGHLGFLEFLYRRVGNDLYDVYHIDNERANAELSVLVGIKPWRSRIILMPGKFEGAHPLEGEEEYLRHDGEDENYDHYYAANKTTETTGNSSGEEQPMSPA